MPKIYYGLHMVEGVAEYRDRKANDGQPYRVLVGESTIKNMDPSFAGKPVYVQHVDDVKVADIEKADGYVFDSFFNTNDGKHWCKFVVVTDAGHEAIKKGWKLSNAFFPKATSGGGRWHGVDYADEITEGEYEHLAIVPNPRYRESIILDPAEFKKYNNDKATELVRLANADDDDAPKGETSMKLDFFKREKVANADLETTLVMLPKTKREVSIATLVNEADVAEEKKAKGDDQMANLEHKVKVGDDTMSVKDLLEKHQALKDSIDDLKDKKDDISEGGGEQDETTGTHKEKKAVDEKFADKVANAEEIKEKKEKAEGNFEKLSNAHNTASVSEMVMTSEDQVARGRARYGSKK